MPKSLIYNTQPEADVVEHVAVGWAKDGTVQLGVVEGPRVAVRIDGEQPDLKGLWMNLGRKQINDLIWSLRRARDSAYGADA